MISLEVHLKISEVETCSKPQWCQHVEKVWGPENTSEHPNLSEVCFLALFLWL